MKDASSSVASGGNGIDEAGIHNSLGSFLYRISPAIPSVLKGISNSAHFLARPLESAPKMNSGKFIVALDLRL